jgi:hypothetical protein
MDNIIIPTSDVEADNIEKQKQLHSLARLLEENPIVLEEPAHVELGVVKPKHKKIPTRDIIDLAVPTQSVEYEKDVKRKMEEAKIMREEKTSSKRRSRKRQLEEMDEETEEILKDHKNKSESMLKKRAVKIVISILLAVILFCLLRKLIHRKQIFSTNVFRENAVADIQMEGGYDSVSFNAPPPLPPSIPSSPEENVVREEEPEETPSAAKAAAAKATPKAATPKAAVAKTTAAKAKASSKISIGRDQRGRFVKRK